MVLCLSTAAAAEPIPKNLQDDTSLPQLGNNVAFSSQTSADGDQAASGDLATDSAFLGGESSNLSPKPVEGKVVAVGLPATETDFGPPIPQDPTKNPSDFGAYPGYPQPVDIPDLYDPKTRQKVNGYMDYYEQTRGECPGGEELYCCRWGQREVLSLQEITSGPIKCVLCQFFSFHRPPIIIPSYRMTMHAPQWPLRIWLVRCMMWSNETDDL